MYQFKFPRAAHDYFTWQNQMDFMKVLTHEIVSDGGTGLIAATFTLMMVMGSTI